MGVCGIIRSLSRVLLGFVLVLVVRKNFLTGMLCRCGVLGDIFFICVGFIRVWVEQGS